MKIFFRLLIIQGLAFAQLNYAGQINLNYALQNALKELINAAADFSKESVALTKENSELEKLRKNANTSAALAISLEQRKVAQTAAHNYFEALKKDQAKKENTETLNRFLQTLQRFVLVANQSYYPE
jgi:hypothetical protein